jgi:cardiolipin synthase
VWSLHAERYRLALALIALAGATDALDGLLARRFAWDSRLGSILDPLADKLMLVSIYAALAWLGHLPVWLAALVVARDIVIVAGAVAFHFLVGVVTMAPTLAGKANTAVQLTLIGVVIGRLAGLPFPGWLGESLVWLTAVTTLWSGVHYVYTWGRRALASRAAA